MTASTESGAQQSRAAGPPDAGWREAALRRQQAALPAGSVAVSCSAPLGAGGLGRHLGEIVAALERSGRPYDCISGTTRAQPRDVPAARPGAESRVRPVAQPGVRSLLRRRLGLYGALARAPLPLSPGVRTRAFMTDFDDFAAARLGAAEHLIAFNGQALAQFEVAARAGYSSRALVSANSHLRHVARRHAEAHRRYPLEGSWTSHLLARNLAEYERADWIYVASGYVRESFLREGFADERLVDFPLTPDPRYSPAEAAHEAGREGPHELDRSAVDRSARPAAPRREGDRFDVVYVGSLAVHKGVPLLIDAFRRLAHTDLRLVLVGGWGTRGMRRFVQAACAADPRILVSPGDPLERLRAASLCVHPAYEDGFAYAPAEALACGVPLLVSEDTGMKELIDVPRRGLILPTGDLDALSEAIDAAYRREAFATSGPATRPAEER
jgi:glycosyltransferase involved in cell wall biosynthesis